MSPSPQLDKGKQQNGDYAKDINLLPDDLQVKVKTKTVQKQASGSSVPKMKSVRQPDSGLKKFFGGLFKKEKETEKPSEPVKREKPQPPQFMASKKPSLQINIKQKSRPKTGVVSKMTKPETPPAPPVPAAPKPVQPAVKEPEPPKAKSGKPTKPVVNKTDKKQPTLLAKVKPEAPQKPKPSKHISFSSLKELVEPEPESETDQFDVNLIPSELISADSQKDFIKKAAIAGLASILVVVIFYSGVSILGAKRQGEIKFVKQEAERLTEEINKAENTLSQLSDFTTQASLVGDVLRGQKKWSRLFELLEQETVPEVYYQAVSISSNNQVGLSLTAKSYRDLARQYLIFQNNPNIEEINMGAATMDMEVWEEYLKELELEAERQAMLQEEGGEEFLPEFKLPSYSEMQQLLTVNSELSFFYKFNAEE